MVDSVSRTRQAVEVLAQDLALQDDRSNAEVLWLNLGRNEVLISFVLLGLADVSDWRLVEKAIYSRRAVLRDVDFRSGCVR